MDPVLQEDVLAQPWRRTTAHLNKPMGRESSQPLHTHRVLEMKIVTSVPATHERQDSLTSVRAHASTRPGNVDYRTRTSEATFCDTKHH